MSHPILPHYCRKACGHISSPSPLTTPPCLSRSSLTYSSYLRIMVFFLCCCTCAHATDQFRRACWGEPVHGLVSKMIFNKEIQASWDQPTGTLVLHKAQPSRLQLLALQLAEKVIRPCPSHLVRKSQQRALICCNRLGSWLRIMSV